MILVQETTPNYSCSPLRLPREIDALFASFLSRLLYVALVISRLPIFTFRGYVNYLGKR
jgi:hypothetical protein